MRPVRTALEAEAMAHELVFLNGGQRGLQVRMSPQDVAMVLKAVVAPLVA
jgi:Cys-tRNA(Pro)/Cys-tRNA(Cys) deacylase